MSSPAELREARKAKILARGTDRLALLKGEIGTLKAQDEGHQHAAPLLAAPQPESIVADGALLDAAAVALMREEAAASRLLDDAASLVLETEGVAAPAASTLRQRHAPAAPAATIVLGARTESSVKESTTAAVAAPVAPPAAPRPPSSLASQLAARRRADRVRMGGGLLHAVLPLLLGAGLAVVWTQCAQPPAAWAASPVVDFGSSPAGRVSGGYQRSLAAHKLGVVAHAEEDEEEAGDPLPAATEMPTAAKTPGDQLSAEGAGVADRVLDRVATLLCEPQGWVPIPYVLLVLLAVRWAVDAACTLLAGGSSPAAVPHAPPQQGASLLSVALAWAPTAMRAFGALRTLQTDIAYLLFGFVVVGLLR